MGKLDIENKEELNKIYQSLSNFSTESQYYDYINKLSVQNNIDYEYLLQKIRQMSIEKNYSGQKDLVKHFHATSFESFETIIKTGELLSRSERKKRGISVENLFGSSSDKVQFSRDYFSTNGDLIRSGLGDGKGATGTEVVFVFGNEIYNEETFDATFHYPTVEKLNIKNACIAVIGSNDDIVNKIRDVLKKYDCDEISVFSSKTWNNQITSFQLEIAKRTKLNNKLAMKNYNIARIKSLTKIQIEDNKGYIGEGILVLKSKQELLEEKERMEEIIDDLLVNNRIDMNEKNRLINFIREEYKNMILKAPYETHSISVQNNNQYEKTNNQLNNNQNTTINNHEEEIIDLVPNKINKLFIKYVYQHYKEIIGYDNLSYVEKFEEEEQIRQGINPKINREILKLKKAYLEVKKANSEIGYNEIFNHLYPYGETDEIGQIDVIESVDRPKMGHK